METRRLEISPEQMKRYRATLRQRQRKAQQELARRRERAWRVARKAGELLRSRFGATRVVVFGSLVHGHRFSMTSDIDLAAWGLRDEDYFVAVAQLQDLSPEFKVDLVAMERCKPSLQAKILSEGKSV